MTPPLVSVVLPTYNRAALLPRAIRSVLAQTMSDLELIVVDDCSTDDTAGIVRQFADPRLRYLRQERNGGASAARNRGIREARGEFLAFQDDDDLWLIERLETQLPSLRNAPPEVGLSLAAHIRLRDTGPVYVGGQALFQAMDFANGVRGNWSLSATPCWLLRRRLLEQTGLFDERIATLEDWELALRLSQVCRFVHVERPLFVQDRVAGGALWLHERGFAPAMQAIMDRHAAFWAQRPDVLYQHYFLTGRVLCMFGDVGEGRRWLRRALDVRPTGVKAWIGLGASLVGARAVHAATMGLRRVVSAWRALRR